ncbi:MAG: type II secretion system F family protein [Pirellulales bacterium]
MTNFAYVARDATGQRVAGTLEATTQREAVSLLSGRELFPLEVAVKEETQFRLRRSPRVKPQLVATTYNQLAALLRSGVPLLRSIDVLRRQCSHAGLRQVLGDVHGRIEEGDSLADAMSRHPKAFSELATSIVRAGAEGGFLEEALNRVAMFTEQQDELKGRVVGALAYPGFLAIVGTVVINVLVIFVVPKFESLFARLREEGQLPFVTDLVVGASKVMQSYGLLLLLGLVIAFFLLRARLQTKEGRRLMDRVRLKLPMAGTIYVRFAVARFCRVLGTLLHGGVPIVRSLRISSDSTGNVVLSEAVQKAADNITAGESLAVPLGQSGHFPQDIVEMISVAEESNTLETVLTDIADSLEKQTWRQLDLAVRLLEPVMLLILAGIVLVVVVALLVPVMRMGMAV